VLKSSQGLKGPVRSFEKRETVEAREFQVALSGLLLLHDLSCDKPFATHFFSKTSPATAMAVTALGQPA
jgi:hypothetical protein